MEFYLAALALPFIGALSRYAVLYGYQGENRAVSFRAARQVFVMLALVMSIVAVIRLVAS